MSLLSNGCGDAVGLFFSVGSSFLCVETELCGGGGGGLLFDIT